MASTTTTLTDRDAYRALETHLDKVAGLHLRDLFAEDPERGDEADRRARRRASGLLQASPDRRDARRCSQTGRRTWSCASGSTRCSPARRSTSPRSGPCCHVALREPLGQA